MVPHSQQTRLEAVQLHLKEGLSRREVSRRLGVSLTSIRTWIDRYKDSGEAGLIPNYSACGQKPQFSEQIINKAIQYKSDHPAWGAGFIIIKLEDDFPAQDLPGARRLQQIFRQKELQPKRTRLPKAKKQWAKRAFDTVQVDAKERLKTKDGKACCYLNFTDEYTGSVLDAFVFPLCPNE